MSGKGRKTAIVTGGAQGLGFEMAAELMRRGTDVMVFDLQEERGREAIGELSSLGTEARCEFVSGSVTDEDDVERTFVAAEDAFESVDYLVNNAGIYAPSGLIVDFEVEDWDRIIEINLRGMFLCLRAFGRRAREGRGAGGAIVNVASLNSEAPSEGTSAYSAAKIGVRQLTKVCALEFAPYKVRVNAVSPGSTPPQWVVESEGDPMVREWLKRTPLDRMGLPSDIARVTAFLLSDDAEWLTGVTIPVDGGQHLRGLQNYEETLNEKPANVVITEFYGLAPAEQ